MQCPACATVLDMTERQGVEIDYCPQCRGVWLDRGELDKLIERSLAVPSFSPAEGHRYTAPREEGFAARRRDDDDEEDYRPRRRKSFLSEIFDFD
jgi:Zn-finger nucleic acid-binding protein